MKQSDTRRNISSRQKAEDADAIFYKRRRERYRQRALEKKRRRTFIAGVIVLLIGISVAAIIHGLTNNSIETAESQPFELSEAAESSEESSEVSEEEPSRFLPDGEPKQFSSSVNKFSTSTRKMLSKKIQSQYVVLYDATEDLLLFQRNGNITCYPASTTKMLTAVTAANILSKDTVITVGDEIEMIGEDSSTAYLQKGMKLTFEMLLDALLLPSGNDAAYTIAVNAAKVYTGNDKLSNEEAVKIFVEQMNVAATEIGCKATHFVTPDGFHDPDHYTTAEDLARIAAYAKTIPLVCNSCNKNFASWELIHDESSAADSSLTSDNSTVSAESSESSAGEASDDDSDDSETSEDEMPEWMAWSNSNALLNKDSGYYSPYADGMKTGFTDEAGTCVVASATINGHTLIAAVMKAPSLYAKYDDVTLLFTEGYKLFNLIYKVGE